MIRAMMFVAAIAVGSWTVSGIAFADKSAVSGCAACCGDDCELCCGDDCGNCCEAGAACCVPGAACCEIGANCCGTSAVAFLADKQPAGKEVKVTGTLVCGSCALKETKKCSNVLQVEENGKTVNYYLDDQGNKEAYHDGICGGEKVKNVTVIGTVTEKDGKKVIKPSKVDAKK